MNFDELYIMNPWWRDRVAIYADRNILQYQQSKFKYDPKVLFSEIDLSIPGIYTLRGPRQVGKTTFSKLLILRLIESGVEPSRILFFTCDMVKDNSELVDLVKLHSQTFASKEKMNYIFIDEITQVPNWQAAIKFLADLGLLDNAVVLLTGSSAYDLKISTERLPGRRGVGKNLIFLPITFSEYLETLSVHLDKLDLPSILALGEDELKIIAFKYSFIEAYFHKYALSGGFPKVIDEFEREGKCSDITKAIYRDFVLGDAEKYMKSRERMIEIFEKLPDIVGQRFSWQSLSNDLGLIIRSVNTIVEYFEFLAYSFIVSIVYFIDPSTKEIRRNKQKKVYPLDPMICSIISETGKKEIAMPQIMELLMLRQLMIPQHIEQTALNLTSGPYFWYSEKGNEIDFIVDREGMLIPIEIKYQNRINKSDYTGMKRVFGKGIVATKDTIGKDGNIVLMPIWLLLALMK